MAREYPARTIDNAEQIAGAKMGFEIGKRKDEYEMAEIEISSNDKHYILQLREKENDNYIK